MYWAKYHIKHLKKWREYAKKIAKAARDIVPEAKVYVIGGAAENRLTVLSDIDILIIVPKKAMKKHLTTNILEKAINTYQLPWDAPVEIHIVEEGKNNMYKGKKIPITKEANP